MKVVVNLDNLETLMEGKYVSEAVALRRPNLWWSVFFTVFICLPSGTAWTDLTDP